MAESLEAFLSSLMSISLRMVFSRLSAAGGVEGVIFAPSRPSRCGGPWRDVVARARQIEATRGHPFAIPGRGVSLGLYAPRHASASGQTCLASALPMPISKSQAIEVVKRLGKGFRSRRCESA